MSDLSNPDPDQSTASAPAKPLEADTDSVTSPKERTASSSISSSSQSEGRPRGGQENEDELLERLSKQMLESTGDYIRGEIEMCVADYKALEKMNRMVTNKYKGLGPYSKSIIDQMTKLNEAYTNLQPLLAQIDDVEKCLSELEQSANKLDVYSKRLETRYRQYVERRSAQMP